MRHAPDPARRVRPSRRRSLRLRRHPRPLRRRRPGRPPDLRHARRSWQDHRPRHPRRRRHGRLAGSGTPRGLPDHGRPPPIFLGYRDSGRLERTRRDDPEALLNADDAAVETALLQHIGRLEPDVMLTFDPHGVYGHVDHLKVHRAATAAFWSAGKVSVAADAGARDLHAGRLARRLSGHAGGRSAGGVVEVTFRRLTRGEASAGRPPRPSPGPRP